MGGSCGLEVSAWLLLVFSVLTAMPLAMIFVSLVLPPTANRWANTAAAVLTMQVVGGGSAMPAYGFFALGGMAGIIRTASPVRETGSAL